MPSPLKRYDASRFLTEPVMVPQALGIATMVHHQNCRLRGSPVSIEGWWRPIFRPKRPPVQIASEWLLEVHVEVDEVRVKKMSF